MDVYLVQPTDSLVSCSIVQGVSNHSGALLVIDWSKTCRSPQMEKFVPLYSKTDVLVLPTFARINLQDGQKMVVAWRRYGKISSSFQEYRTFCSTQNSEKKKFWILNTAMGRWNG